MRPRADLIAPHSLHLKIGCNARWVQSSLTQTVGAVECLQKEIRPFGLTTHVIVLGQFRTNILAENNRKLDCPKEIRQYDGIIGSLLDWHPTTNNKQLGNPVLAVARIVDAVLCEGLYSNIKDIPLRIVLGSDALTILRKECEESIQELKRFEAHAASTDFPDTLIVEYKWIALARYMSLDCLLEPVSTLGIGTPLVVLTSKLYIFNILAFDKPAAFDILLRHGNTITISAEQHVVSAHHTFDHFLALPVRPILKTITSLPLHIIMCI